jgi:DNA-directed RNA polymerase subunit K/omega
MSDSEEEQYDTIGDLDLFNNVENLLNKKDIIDELKINSSSDDDDIEYNDEPDPVSKPSDAHKLKINTLHPACDSRMPDVMSIYEFTSLVIARATAIENGSDCLVNCDTSWTPAQKAKIEIIMGVTNRSVLRIDTDGNHYEWRPSGGDFSYFPANCLEELELLKTMHLAASV